MRGELQIQVIELNILNIESRTADNGWSSEVLLLASDWLGCFLGQSPTWIPENVYYIIYTTKHTWDS